jgi:uncharacterized membrane protein
LYCFVEQARTRRVSQGIDDRVAEVFRIADAREVAVLPVRENLAGTAAAIRRYTRQSSGEGLGEHVPESLEHG